MLKMTIDNEEVLSNNDISIKEEILSPSSTILNNVYPKSWELDKDYTSRFYYPKDYSKLNIQNFSIEPEEAGTTIQVNGSATLTNVDTSKESRVLRILGQTSQNGTPTPSSPIPINVVSGDNTINICGKNLYDLTTTSFSNSNVDITINDQEITMKTKTQTNSGNLFFMTKIPDEILQNGQTYTISSIDVSGVAQSLKLQLRTKTGGFVNGKNRQDSVVYDDTYSLYVDGNIYSNLNSDIIPAGTIVKIKNIQVEKGSTATTYEPYIGHSYHITLPSGIELCEIGDYVNFIFKAVNGNIYYDSLTQAQKDELTYGSWYLHKEIGKYVFTGSETFTSQSYGTNSWLVNSIINTISNDNLKLCISNIFTGISKNERNNEVSNSIYANTTTALYIRNTSFTSQAQIRSATNGNYVYYILATPTDTLIEDTTLIEQLEALQSES